MSVSVVFARSLVEELQARGLDAQPVLETARIDQARLGNIRESLEVDEAERLIEGAVELTEDESLGLSIGSCTPQHSLHVFGHLILAQPTPREAFVMAERYARLIANGPVWKLIEEGDTATWGLFSPLPPSRVRRVLMDYAVSMARVVGRSLTRRGGCLQAVCFQHGPTDYLNRYQEVFGVEPRFDQEINGLIFPRAVLDRRRTHADDTVATLMQESAEQLLREREQGERTGAKVREVLRYHVDLAVVSLDSTARACKMTPRLLRRKLLDEGLSFSGLLDEARCRVACEALQRRDVSIQQTAERLGFSEPSAFFRAFKRWTGKTPSQYRREIAGQSVSHS